MEQNKVFIVQLRRPRSATDGRNDPFWEFGSFGLTGCHERNLLNPAKSDRLIGARFAFAQGGHLGTRLLYLTPPITVTIHKNKIEVKWTPVEMPFCYREAPKLAYNRKPGDFPELEKILQHGRRNTVEAQFSSQFRSRTKPLEDLLAEELIRVYTKARKKSSHAIATVYSDALPSKLKIVDSDRQHTYEQKLIDARSEVVISTCIRTLRKKYKLCKICCTS